MVVHALDTHQPHIIPADDDIQDTVDILHLWDMKLNRIYRMQIKIYFNCIIFRTTENHMVTTQDPKYDIKMQ